MIDALSTYRMGGKKGCSENKACIDDILYFDETKEGDDQKLEKIEFAGLTDELSCVDESFDDHHDNFRHGSSRSYFFRHAMLYPIDRREIIARLMHMQNVEHMYEPRLDYIDSVQVDGMLPIWRTKLFEWMLGFVDEFNVDIATIASAMNYVDRYLGCCSTKLGDLQLVSFAALLVATKLHEVDPLSIVELQVLADGMYRDSDIRDMELKLLNALKWRLNPVTSFCFLRHVLLCFKTLDISLVDEVLNFAETFLEIIICEYSFSSFSPSEAAIAAALIAVDVSAYRRKMSHHTRYSYAIELELTHFGIMKNSPRALECKEMLRPIVDKLMPEIFYGQNSMP